MSNITAAIAAEYVAEDIGLCWPDNADRIFKVLTNVQNEIWKSGQFFGSVKWFDVKVMPNNQIITPHGYGVMLGLDINGKPRELRDQYFLFHKNGPGDIANIRSECKGWNKNVYELSISPVLIQPTEEACRQMRIDCNPKKIMVKSDCGNSDPPYPRTLVSGLGPDGFPIYSYRGILSADDPDGETQVCSCTRDQILKNEIEGLEGVEFDITSRAISANIRFAKITNIVKPVTLTPVEYYMVCESGVAIMIARLEPWQNLSQYHIYQIPQQCANFKTLLGLFKRNRPDRIVDGNQLFISSNLEAIKSLAIAMDYKYNKKNISAAAPYVQDAAGQLNAEMKEERSGVNQPLQIENLQGYASIPKM